MIVALLVVGGLAFGSFVNALVWRLHKQATAKHMTKAQKKKLSIVSGRSMCVHCHHELAWMDLMPVISWLSLRGKCRYCGHKIEDSPIVEIGTAILFVGSYMAWPFAWDGAGIILFGLWLVFLVSFMALVVYDLRWMELPNKIVYPLIGLAIVQVGVMMVMSDEPFETLLGAFWGFLVIGGLFYVLFQLSGGRWIGGGDVKLSFMIGLLVGGPLHSLLVIFLASLGGTLISVPLMATKRVDVRSRVPFGPFLLAATIVVYLYGTRISDWYIGSFF